MKILKTIIPISVLVALVWGVKSCYDSEIRREDTPTLSLEKINSIEYPWSVVPNTITQVKNYKEAYDIDSNDWIAQFSLDSSEAQKLSSVLTEIPESQRVYRCAASNADWTLDHDVCSFEKMITAGFKGYFYNPSLCQAGCKQTIILWVKEASGESYIVGSPDYD
jgi:hypothetical protein